MKQTERGVDHGISGQTHAEPCPHSGKGHLQKCTEAAAGRRDRCGSLQDGAGSGFGDPLQVSQLTVCFADEHEAKFGFIGQDDLFAVANAISRRIL